MSPREPRQGWGGEVKSLQFCIREKKCILNIYKPIKRPIFIPNFLEATCEARLRSFEVCQFKKPFKGLSPRRVKMLEVKKRLVLRRPDE